MIGKVISVLRRLRGLTRVDARIAALERQMERRNAVLKEELDTLKSSLELDIERAEEFVAWKRANPVPERPLVSVCVPTFDLAGALVERCLASILSQTYSNLEVLVAADRCTDDTRARVEGIGDPRIRLFEVTDRDEYPRDAMHHWMVSGVVPANLLFENVTGDFVTQLDDDDEFAPDRVERLLAFALENECDFVWHPFWWETPDGEWRYNAAERFAMGQLTTSSVFYRSWFVRIHQDPRSYRLGEPADWNRFRRIKYLRPASMRYPEPLLRKHHTTTERVPCGTVRRVACSCRFDARRAELWRAPASPVIGHARG